MSALGNCLNDCYDGFRNCLGYCCGCYSDSGQEVAPTTAPSANALPTVASDQGLSVSRPVPSSTLPFNPLLSLGAHSNPSSSELSPRMRRATSTASSKDSHRAILDEASRIRQRLQEEGITLHTPPASPQQAPLPPASSS